MILKCRTVAKKLETHSAFELMMEITLWTDLHTTKQWGIMHKLSPAHIRCLPPLVCNRHFTRLILEKVSNCLLCTQLFFNLKRISMVSSEIFAGLEIEKNIGLPQP
jgi:hypothetical protein